MKIRYPKTILIIWIILSRIVSSASKNVNGQSEHNKSGRHKRAIVFPRNSLAQLTVSLQIPMNSRLVGTRNQMLSIAAPFAFTLPSLSPNGFFGRSLDSERKDILSVISSTFDSFGLDGVACVQRAACEVLTVPLNEYGFIGEIIRLLFISSNPRVTPADLLLGNNVDSRNNGTDFCSEVSMECPVSIFKLIPN